jgi:hypothetical protein
MGRLVKTKFPVTLWTVRPGLGLYVHCVMAGHMCNTLVK